MTNTPRRRKVRAEQGLLGGHAPREEQDSASGQASPPFVHHKNRRNHTLTEKRILHVGSHGKAHFGSLAQSPPHEKAHFGSLAQSPPHGKAHSACELHGKAHPTTCRFARVRLSVRRRDRVRLSVRRRHVCAGEEKRTLRKSAFWDHTLTEKRTLHLQPHGKAHSARWISRKSAFCTLDLTEKRILHVGSHGKAHFGSLAQSPPHEKAHSALCGRPPPRTSAPADACPRRCLPRRCSSNV